MARKILVVDDERHIVRLIEINLQRAGYDVITAYDGAEAFAKVKSEKPDMVVCDNLMPQMDGYGLLSKLRADPATNELPAIMLIEVAVENRDREIYKYWMSGADSILTKPLNPRELLYFVEKIFQSRDETSATSS